MESLLLQLAHPGPDADRLIAWGALALAAALAPLLAWRLARQRADIRSISSSLREGTKAGGALPRLPEARTAPVRRLSADLADWAHRHSHQILWMKTWTQKRQAEWRLLHEQLALLPAPIPGERQNPPGASAPLGGQAPEPWTKEGGETLARAAREMEEALQEARTLARAVRGMEESGKGSETAALRAALEGLTRSLAEGAQLLEDVQRRTEPAGGGLTGPQDGAATLRRMMALAEGVAAEHRKMEGDLAKLLEGFLPDAAVPDEGRTSSALDAATST